tara:strand:- start:125 stop:1117 length:993 start_codon:yes stop_codon:yes gene_type:complete
MSIEPETDEEFQESLFTEERSGNFTDPIDVLSEDASDIEVSVVDDTPEEDRNRPPRGETPEDVDETIPGLSERVKSRMDTLRYEFHSERRDKESAQRENTEAVRYAQNVQTENKTLKDQLSNSRRLLYDQVSAKNDVELDAAKRRFKEAYETGDADAISDAQSDVSRLHAERSHYNVAASDAYGEQPVQQEALDELPEQKHVPPPDPKAVAWLQRNAWFRRPGYEQLTGFAIGVHEQLVRKGYNPLVHNEYYEIVDRELRDKFPDSFEKEASSGRGTPTSRKTPVVAPAGRGGKKPSKVELSSSQVRLASKLGITPEQYAAQVVKEIANG